MKLLTKFLNRKSAYVSIEPVFSSFSGDVRTNATFRAAVDCIGRHAAKLEAHSDNERLQTLLSQAPNRYMTGYDLLYKTATALYSQNNAFLWIDRNGDAIKAIYPLNPSSLELRASPDGNELFIEFMFSDGRSATLPYADILHLRRHYLNGEILGDSNTPLSGLLETAETLQAGISASVKNGTAIRGVLKFTSLVNTEQVKAEQERFIRDYFNPSNSGGIAAVDQRFDFNPVKSEPYEIPQDTIDAVNMQIYSYLGVNPAIVDGTFTEAEFSAFYESVIEPFALQLSQEIKLKTGETVIFSPERLEFSSADTKIKLLRYAAPMGVLSVNEARSLLSLPPVPDGEARLQSLNYIDSSAAKVYQVNQEKEMDTDGNQTKQSPDGQAHDLDRSSNPVRQARENRESDRSYQEIRARWRGLRRNRANSQSRRASNPASPKS